MAPPPYPIIPTSPARKPRYGLLVMGGLALAAAGVAAGLFLQPAGALPDILGASSLLGTTPPAQVATPVPAQGTAPMAAPAATAQPLLARSAAVCAACGTVEAVAGKNGEGYEVRVRMDDGSLRSFTSRTQPTPGAAVRVEGDGFRVVGGSG